MALQVIGDSGKAVDWFFMYKLPAGAGDPSGKTDATSKGSEYLYFDDATSDPIALSKYAITDVSSGLYVTLAQLQRSSAGAGYLMYNDEPPTDAMDGRYGHTKGVLAFDVDTDSAFWLIHSTPKFPSPSDPLFPDSGVGNAQAFLCITLEGVASAEKIAAIMRVQQQPQIYSTVLPKSLKQDSPLRALADGVDLKSKEDPATLRFSSKAGEPFRLFAKNPNWGRDLWRELVAENLGVDLEVETWRRLELDRDASGGKESDNEAEDVEDVRYINLEHIGLPFEWRYTKDHAKLATSKEYDWVIVADINRDKSQASRGGGAVAFQNQSLWDSVTRAEVIYDPETDLEYQKLMSKRAGKKKGQSRPIKARGKSSGARISVALDAGEIAGLEGIAKAHKFKSLEKTIRYLIKSES